MKWIEADRRPDGVRLFYDHTYTFEVQVRVDGSCLLTHRRTGSVYGPYIDRRTAEREAELLRPQMPDAQPVDS